MAAPVRLGSAKTVLRSSKEGIDQSNPTVLGPLSADDIVPAVDHAPSVTVFTNIAGAVAVTVDRDSSIGAKRRLCSKPLPENPFNPFRAPNSRRRQLVDTPRETQRANSAGAAAEGVSENVHVTSAAAAAVAVEGIKKGVRDALDRWALQTSRRESMVLWRHECSRYASSSRIGYHPNHPSSSHPSSRPSSAATTLRPFSAGHSPHHEHQRASSALSRRSLPLGGEAGEGGGGDKQVHTSGEGSEWSLATGPKGVTRGSNRRRPRSAIPRLGVDIENGMDDLGGVVDHRPARGNSASAARSEDGTGGGEGASIGGRRLRKDGNSAVRRRTVRSASTRSPSRSRSPVDRQRGSNGEVVEGEDELIEDIYEDLDDEDDGELDNRISIMESRFSTVGRERPTSAVDAQRQRKQRRSGPQRTTVPSAPRSAATQRPPRAPPQDQQQASTRSRSTRRQLVSSAKTDGSANTETGGGTTRTTHQQYPPPSSNVVQDVRPPRIVRSRPTSAPVDRNFDDQQHQRGGNYGGVYDPMAPLHARRLRLQVSSARAQQSRSAVGWEQDGGGGTGAGNVQQQRKSSTRDVTTAVPSWDREADGGNRPSSSATTEGGDPGNTTAAVESEPTSSCANNGSRPSSAAFRNWIKARPSARSVVSAVSSARTLGMDDPELVHLQLEMESRRGGMSEATLARMEDHYTAVVLKNSNTPQSRRRQQPVGRKGIIGAGVGAAASTRKKGGGTSKKSPGRKSRSKSPSKGRKKKGKKAGGKGKRGGGGGGGGVGEATTAATKKVYPSALAFMAEHFPSEDRQGVSLLGMEQEEECRHASETLSRAGVTVSSAALRRALVIPTDRPLETCLAGLPRPMEGLRDGPFPAPPPPLLLPTIRGHHPPSLLLSPSSFPVARGSRGGKTKALVSGVKAAVGLSKGGGRKKGGGGAGGRGKPSAVVGGARGRKKKKEPVRRR